MGRPITHIAACPALSTRAREDVGHAAFDGRNATNNEKAILAKPASV